MFNQWVDSGVIIKVSDKEIIELIKCGRHEEAFNGIVDAYSERLYWHIRRFLCSHEDTDDMLQDVFIKIWTALPSFRAESKIFTWIYRIATNEVLNHIRRMRLRSLVSMESVSAVLAGKIDDDPHFNGDHLQRELHKSIQRLPEKQRIVFSLRYFDEMKYEDISDITGTSIGALKASYHHAYTKIADELKKLS